MFAVGSTFGGMLRAEEKGDYCRIRVDLNVTKPLRRGVFVSLESQGKVWLAFKYENLPTFCFCCGHMGHGVAECGQNKKVENIDDDWPYSIALKVESSLMGKEWMRFGVVSRKSMPQRVYVGQQRNEKEQMLAAVVTASLKNITNTAVELVGTLDGSHKKIRSDALYDDVLLIPMELSGSIKQTDVPINFISTAVKG